MRHRWIHRPNLRYYEQKNAGLLEARTPYAALSDSDAAPDADWLEAALDAMDAAPTEVVAVTGRTRFRPGPFSRELELAQWPHLRSAAYDCDQILAHNVLFRVEALRALLFTAPRIRHGGENALVAELLRRELRIRYDPGLRMTHNYARRIGEIWLHAAARGFSYANFEAHEGKPRASVLWNGVGRYRVLARRLLSTARHFDIPNLRYPLSLLFFAWYCVAVGSGYSRALRGRPEPFAAF
jgi:glycosyltransferase involved in cell wall biosynthesis